MKQNITEIKSRNDNNFVVSNKKIYETKLIFDSRPLLYNKKNGLFQHFYGEELEFKKNIFDSNEVILMDFQSYKNGVHFFYILPYSKKKALIETTYFSTKIFNKSRYTKDITTYVKKKYGNISFKKKYTESGIIPMFRSNIEYNNSNKIIKIGTAGNWMRLSTGYSFQNSFLHAKKISNNIITNKKPRIRENFFLLILDLIFCEYIKMYPKHSTKFFESFFSKVKLQTIAKFLTGSSNIFEIFRILFSLPKIKLIISSFTLLKKKIIYEQKY